MKPLKLLFVTLTLSLTMLFACSEKSSCDDTICLNGGFCMDGSCNCPTGFSGIHCQDKATPDYMRITALSVTRFPAVNGNMTWDQTDGPDIFFRLFDGKNTVGQPDYLIENAVISSPNQFIFHFIDISYPEKTYRLQLLDYDGINTKEDFMGEISFIPFIRENGFPDHITLDEGGTVAFEIDVAYFYNNDGS